MRHWTGLNNRACSGLCRPGYYCLKGSVSPVSAICAAGLYGSVAGLQSPECSGSCTAGYYCPAGSTVPTAVECGGANVYCPVGSPLPVPVSVGHYTIGGWETRRTAQAICEPGFYCYEGLKYPCPAGTFGDVFGLPLDPSLATFTCSGGSSARASRQPLMQWLMSNAALRTLRLVLPRLLLSFEFDESTASGMPSWTLWLHLWSRQLQLLSRLSCGPLLSRRVHPTHHMQARCSHQ